jgi:hypothetical protein
MAGEVKRGEQPCIGTPMHYGSATERMDGNTDGTGKQKAVKRAHPSLLTVMFLVFCWKAADWRLACPACCCCLPPGAGLPPWFIDAAIAELNETTVDEQDERDGTCTRGNTTRRTSIKL